MGEKSAKGMRQLHGSGGAPGIAIGRAVYLPAVPEPQHQIDDPATTLERFKQATASAARRLMAFADQQRHAGRIDVAGILEYQAYLAEDPTLAKEVAACITSPDTTLSMALHQALAHMRRMLTALDDRYLRERATDIDAVGAAIEAALAGGDDRWAALASDMIVIAPDLAPADILELHGRVAGVAVARGSTTGHTAIIASACGLPAVVGLGEAIQAIPESTELILDGDQSSVLVKPTRQQRHAYELKAIHAAQTQVRQRSLVRVPGQLRDGRRIPLLANIARPTDVGLALEYGAEGIGLFRTEFFYMDREAPPDEEEQYAAYRLVLDTMAPQSVTVRTFDLGGDKQVAYLPTSSEPNPALGLRGLRLAMHEPALFQNQLRALLRAAAHGPIQILLPMVTTIQDVLWARAQLQEAAATLGADRVLYGETVPLGIMIETPAAALMADQLASQVDFFSIGSNDLAQYVLAVDRALPDLANQYAPDDPAVMRLIGQVAQVARAAQIPCSVCGELAGQPETAIRLVASGVASLSMTPRSIPLVKEKLREYSLHDVQRVVQV